MEKLHLRSNSNGRKRKLHSFVAKIGLSCATNPLFSIFRRMAKDSERQGDTGRFRDLLAEVAKRLGGVGAQFEPDFIELGNQLQTAFQKAESLTQQTRRTVAKLSSRDEGNLLLQVSRVADMAVEELDGYRRRMMLDLASLSECTEHLNALFKLSGTIKKISLFLRVLGLNLGVESARCEDGRTLFGVVAKDVIDLSEKISVTVCQLQEDSSAAIAVQRSAHRAVAAEFDRTRELAGNARKELRAAADGVQHLMDGAKEAMENAGRRSQIIAEQVGQIVAGIQFHDNMSQRLAHIVMALDNAIQIEHDSRDAADGLSDKVSSAHAIVALQQAQLENVMAEARTAHRQNETAFSTIYEQIDELKSGLARFGRNEPQRSDGRTETLVRNHFGGLLAALENLDRILRTGAPMIARVVGALEEAGRSAGRISDHAVQVGQVSTAVHMIALNAIIKAAHMGEKGLTLEVLAQEVRRLSRQANDVVNSFRTLMASISGIVGADETARDSDTESRDSPQSIEDQIRNGIEQIHQIHVRFKADADAALEAADKLKLRIASIQASLFFFSDLHRTLSDCHGRLQSIAKELPRNASEPVGSGVDEAARLAAHYTMAQERKVHSRLFTNEAASIGAIVASTQDGKHTDETEMEFFEDSSDAKTGAENGYAENVEFFDGADDGHAGDVELFDGPDNGNAENVEFFDGADDGHAGDVELFDGPDNGNAENVEFFDGANPAAFEKTEEIHAGASETRKSTEKPSEAKSKRSESADGEASDLGDNIEFF